MRRFSWKHTVPVLVCILLVFVPASAQEFGNRSYLPIMSSGAVPAPSAAKSGSMSSYLPLVSGTRPFLNPAKATAGTALVSWEYDQVAPTAAYNPQAGQHLVVWEDHHWDWGADADIYGRRVGLDGTAVGDKFGVAWEGAGKRLAPDIAAGSGEFLVVWEHTTTADNHDILGRRVSSTGVLAGGEFTVTAGVKSEANPAIAYNAFNQTYLAVWEHVHVPGDVDIRAQRLNPDGTPAGSFMIVDQSPNDQVQPDVACSTTDGRCLMVWSGDPDGDDDYDIYGMTLSADGSSLSSRIEVEAWSGDQVTPRVAWHALRNQFLVVWADGHWDWWNTTLYGELLSTDGATVDDLTITSTLDGRAEEPDVIYFPAAQGWLIAWEQEVTLDNHNIYRRLFSGSGSPLGAAEPVAVDGHTEGTPAIAAGTTEQALVVWQDNRNAPTLGLDLYMAAVPAATLKFSGAVFKGTSGETSSPLKDVPVKLTCSNDAGNLGSDLDSTTTDATGAYSLRVYEPCEYYHIQETDPPEYVSVAADSPSGTVVNANYIRYGLPLAGKQLDGNNFWDVPSTPDDTIPPGSWANFAPTVWQDTQTVPVQVQVQDTQSGLAVTTARFALSKDGGATWSAWAPAVCSGTDGSQQPLTITADAAFGQDSTSAGLNQVKFRIRDMDGNEGTSPAYSVKIDTVAPQNPTGGTCAPHQPGVWSKTSKINCTWSGASDAASGIGGYSYLWDHSATGVPPAEMGIADAAIENWPLADHNTWYLHIRALDTAGNAASGALHLGPYRIDATPPETAVSAGPNPVSSPSFTVAWGGGDALSGLENYDVEYQDLSANGTWTAWKSNTTGTSATFQGQDGHLYDFRCRGRDKAGNVEPWPPSADRRVGVATVDFEALQPALEVTQAIQDMNNGVDLVEDKPTYVRFHVRSTTGPTNLTAELKGFRGGTELGTLQPGNPGQVIVVNNSPQRSQLDHSFHFLLPADWRKGSVLLQAQVNPDHRLIESDYTDNYAATTVSFLKTPPLRVVFVPITYTLNSTVRTPRAAAVNDIRGHLRRIYPIGQLTSSIHATTLVYTGTMAALCSGAGYPTLLADLATLQSTSNTSLGGNTIYYGTVPHDYTTGCPPPGFVTGMAQGIPSTVSAGIVPADVTFTGNNAAHELGHCLGRGHANFCGAAGGPAYPYPNGEISPNATPFFGFDVETMTVYPTTHHDLMSYCWADMWISDFTYEALRTEIAKYPKAQTAAAGDVLLVSGLWNRTRGTTSLNPLYRLPGLPPTAQEGSCRVVLRRSSGETLAEYRFVPGQDTQPMPGKDEIVVLHTLVPDDPALGRVDVYCEGDLLASRTTSGHAPVVKVLAPNGDETWQPGTQTIRWQASDADGDPLRFLVQYSTDGGATWLSLAVDVTGSQYSFDTARLAGSARARVRVVATDGLLTGTDVSDDEFRVTGRAPQVSIDGPADGARLPPGKAVTLYGYAWDPEEGPLPDATLTWRSDQAGVMGQGQELTVGPLAPGRHHLTLTATDGEGMQGTAAIDVLVAESQPVLLPLIRNAQ